MCRHRPWSQSLTSHSETRSKWRQFDALGLPWLEGASSDQPRGSRSVLRLRRRLNCETAFGQHGITAAVGDDTDLLPQPLKSPVEQSREVRA